MMKKYLLIVSALCLALPSVLISESSSAGQVCTTVTRYRTERYWTGKQWSSSSMPYFEQDCRFVPDSTPQQQPQTQTQTMPTTNQDLAIQYLTQRYQGCVNNGVSETKCRCAFTRVGNTYSADQIVQYAREQNAGFLLAEGVALLACPSK